MQIHSPLPIAQTASPRPNAALPEKLAVPEPAVQNAEPEPSNVPTEGVSQKPEPLAVRPPSPPLAASASTSSSYLTSILYEHSSLASVPDWHLPKAPEPAAPTESPSTLPALLTSHQFLSLSAPSLLPPNPSRHGLAMTLLGLSTRGYSPAATLYGSSTTNACTPLPRRAAPLATHAVPLDKNGKVSFSVNAGKGALPVPPPDWHARSAGGPVAFTEPTTMQGNRIPLLSRLFLTPSLLTRATQVLPPSPLERNNQRLLYGPPIPAPWNSTQGVVDKKDKDDEDDEEENKVLADAHLFATWDYDPKDFRGPLPVPRRGSKVSTGSASLKRKRSDSVVPGRRGSEVYG
ncbi:hypothetical protein M422DRAFT_45895 [Sphaerobolus stellatus SS14]|nr:hypothetical protein M422DRAFT_45895 [Sphaerobolus stellatus SS14]